MIKNEALKKPLIGCLPAFNNLGDVLPLLEIAKEYKRLGGDVIFFSQYGKFDFIIEKAGFKIIQIKLELSKKNLILKN